MKRTLLVRDFCVDELWTVTDSAGFCALGRATDI